MPGLPTCITKDIIARVNKRLTKGTTQMATKLFIGKLSFDTTEASLTEEFAKYGKVASAAIIMDRDTNRSKGFGFVEMDTAEEAEAAIKALDGKDFEGRTIVVNIAKPREDKPRGGGGGFSRSW